MSVAIEILVFDDASPAIQELSKVLTSTVAKRRAANDAATLTRDHIGSLGPNKRWPGSTTGFYPAIAKKGVNFSLTGSLIQISIDHPEIPGAFGQRFWGGPIYAKDKLLTIPASEAFYGHRAGEFENLQFGWAIFKKSGIKSLIVGIGGAGRVNFGTGRSERVKGAGRAAVARAKEQGRSVVAYWLKDKVDQKGNRDVLPKPMQYREVVVESLMSTFKQRKARNN